MLRETGNPLAGFTNSCAIYFIETARSVRHLTRSGNACAVPEDSAKFKGPADSTKTQDSHIHLVEKTNQIKAE